MDRMSFRPTPPDKVAVTIHTLLNFHRYSDLDNKWMQMLVSLPPANEVWGKVIFSESCVKNSVHRGGVCLSACWDTPLGAGTPPGSRQHPPPGADPPGAEAPRSRTPPVQSMLGDTVKARSVRILLECNLVYCFFAERMLRETQPIGLASYCAN